MPMNIAIDGPSGAGKSTLAKRLAKELGILYLNTGAMYRGIAYHVLKKGVDPAAAEAVRPLLKGIDMRIEYDPSCGVQQIIINGENVTPFIREHRISFAASTVSKIPEVRLKLVELQRAVAAENDCVLDGRDIGSYVLPDADIKIYLDAKPEIRADRRFKELEEKGQLNGMTPGDVLADVNKRDYQDMHRDFAPLIVADGAKVVDTSGMNADEVVETIKDIIRECK